jgi:hypothetical protein
MSGARSWGGRARAASTAVVKLLAVSAGRLPTQAASISLIRVVSAARRSFSNFECFVNANPPVVSRVKQKAARGDAGGLSRRIKPW